MTDCIHCGTPFTAAPDVQFCCKGCEFVHELIHEEGLSQFYDLRRDTPVQPARSVPFQQHDFDWLATTVAELEASGVAEADFSLDGISCIGCVWLVERVFLRHPGGLDAAAHPVTGNVRLTWRLGETDLPAFARELTSFGYTLGPPKAGGKPSLTSGLGVRLGLCGAFMLNAMAFTLPSYLGMPDDAEFAGVFQLIAMLTATLSMLVGGGYFISRAWRAARMGTLHIDLPIALGLVVAYIGSIIGWALEMRGLAYFDFVSTFVFLMLAGRHLQLAAVERNRNRLRRGRPLPDTLTSPDRADPLPLAELAAGMRFLLGPGQVAPVAAVMHEGEADFSLEWINGEAESYMFSAGRAVPAGAISLGDNPVILTAAETWEASLLARLTGGPTIVRQPMVEKVLKYYLLCVLVIGTAGFATWWRLEGPAMALQVAISIFVISCPCALGLALPLADEISSTLMERAGVFIRRASFWPRLRRVRTIIFDKTGTLTPERPELLNAETLAALDHAALAALARLTNGSQHPVSRTLLEALGRTGQEILRIESAAAVVDTPGHGRHLVENGAEWSLGKPGWRGDVPVTAASPHDVELRRDGQVVASFRFRECLRADAADSVHALQRAGCRIVILSGDRAEKVTAAARMLELDLADAHSGMLPEEKAEVVRALDKRDTLYLGDGANDSLAFDAAWTTGTPVADRGLLESKADFYFMGSGLRFLPQMLELAHRRRRAVVAAFVFAVTYNLTTISICLAGSMSPLLAAILMPSSSVISLVIVSLGLRKRTRRAADLELVGNPAYDVGDSQQDDRRRHPTKTPQNLRKTA